MTTARKSVDLQIKNVDRDGVELRVGDRIGFIMRGWFQPREQESFGIISEIDSRGMIRIDLIESYRRFTSSGKVGIRDKIVLFTHHIYDPVQRLRIYSKTEGSHQLSIFHVATDEIGYFAQEGEDANAPRKPQAVATFSRSATRRGR